MLTLTLLVIGAVIALLIIYRNRIDWTTVGNVLGSLASVILDILSAIGTNSSSGDKRDRYKGGGGSSGGGGNSGSF